jgi:hypothetical protein
MTWIPFPIQNFFAILKPEVDASLPYNTSSSLSGADPETLLTEGGGGSVMEQYFQ